MRSVSAADVRARARKLVEQRFPAWAAKDGTDAVLQLPLHPPTERDVLADQAAVFAWVREWRAAAEASADLQVTWAQRRWPSVGSQRVPERCTIEGADAIARVAGAAVARDWARLRRRADALRTLAPIGWREEVQEAVQEAIRVTARGLRNLPENDFETMLQVLAWLAEHPTSEYRIRQLPIHGIDTKWMERHRSLVECLHRAVNARDGLGLLGPPDLVRVRFLDPYARPGGLTDVTAPVEQLAELRITPDVVYVFENLETVLAMPQMPNAVVVHGSGYAVRRLGAIPWVRGGHILYWGDLDSDGFAILNGLRTHLDDVTSVLMDDKTLLAHRDLWVPDPQPAAGSYPMLTAEEQATRERLHLEGDVRLEQERIEWSLALAALSAARRQGASP